MTNLNSKIEWTDATLNVVTGCTKVSDGCDHCYAEKITERFHGKGSFAEVKLHEDRLNAPLHWRKPRRVFVNSMSDLFHQDVPDEFIARAFAAMALTPRHSFQILTKRHGRMRSLLNRPDFQEAVAEHATDLIGARPWQRWQIDTTGWTATPSGTAAGNLWYPPWPLPGVWLGVSVEDQKRADLRIPALLGTPAAVRFLSCEPLLGPVDLVGELAVGCEDVGPAITHHGYSTRTDYGTGIEYDCEHQVGIDWVIVGGESGPDARPMELDWARSLIEQCRAARVPVFVKQDSGPKPGMQGRLPDDLWSSKEFPAVVPS
jgi:protein gp37